MGWIEKATTQAKEVEIQVRVAQSQLAEEAAAVEHHPTKTVAKGMEDFRQSEAFRKELLVSCQKVFFTSFNQCKKKIEV